MSRGGVGRGGGAGRRRNAGGAGGGKAERTVQADPWSTVGPEGDGEGGYLGIWRSTSAGVCKVGAVELSGRDLRLTAFASVK